MASSYPASVGAVQVGSYFVQQYYQVLQQQPDFVHHFYKDASTMVRIDGDANDSASAILSVQGSDMLDIILFPIEFFTSSCKSSIHYGSLTSLSLALELQLWLLTDAIDTTTPNLHDNQIHTLVMSLNFTGIEIKTINSLESWSGGVLVVVSGSVKSKDFSGWRKFVQSFFLAPQENGYFVLNDVFHFASEEFIHEHPAPILPENRVDSPPTTATPLPQLSISKMEEKAEPVLNNLLFCQVTDIWANLSILLVAHDYALEVEASENLTSVHIEGDDAVQEYTVQEEEEPQPQPQPQPQPREVEHPITESAEESPIEESHALPQNVVDPEPEPLPAVEEPTGEPRKFTYASILQAPKGKYAPPVASQPFVNKSAAPPASDWPQMPQPTAQPLNPVSSFVPNASVEVAVEGFSQEEESKSIYVRNLPSTVSTFDILKEFKHFGAIKPDGVVLKNRKESGVCFAFVDFEDVESAQNAIKNLHLRHLQYSWMEGKSTLRRGEQTALPVHVEEEEEEVEEVTKMRAGEGVLVAELLGGEAIKMVVTTSELEAMMPEVLIDRPWSHRKLG
ncbi:hypothetical protein LguiA_011657 [Lonicera macranthoides]